MRDVLVSAVIKRRERDVVYTWAEDVALYFERSEHWLGSMHLCLPLPIIEFNYLFFLIVGGFGRTICKLQNKKKQWVVELEFRVDPKEKKSGSRKQYDYINWFLNCSINNKDQYLNFDNNNFWNCEDEKIFFFDIRILNFKLLAEGQSPVLNVGDRTCSNTRHVKPFLEAFKLSYFPK